MRGTQVQCGELEHYVYLGDAGTHETGANNRDVLDGLGDSAEPLRDLLARALSEEDRDEACSDPAKKKHYKKIMLRSLNERGSSHSINRQLL